jgi:hypothetical protein
MTIESKIVELQKIQVIVFLSLVPSAAACRNRTFKLIHYLLDEDSRETAIASPFG